jgi:carbonic anhydrase
MNALTAKDLLERNRLWSEETRRADPDFFSGLVDQQNPRFLWIGCSDSRVPANQITGLAPGEVFVHRNVANIAHPTDVNLMSVLEYAVDVLKVLEILVVGHYGCGGVRAALQGRLPGIADFWLEPIREIHRKHKTDLGHLPAKQMEDRVCELNVIEQVAALSHSGIVQGAWQRGQPLAIHGWIYSLGDGVLQDLGVTCSAAAIE